MYIDLGIIRLSAGKFAVVDGRDFARVSRHTWHYNAQGYAARNAPRHEQRAGGRQKVYLHRFIMGEPEGLVDHRNRNGVDNRRKNLRHANKSLNGLNAKIRRNNKSGITGVCWNKEKRAWDARIQVNGIGLNLGRFRVLGDAVTARLRAEREYVR